MICEACGRERGKRECCRWCGRTLNEAREFARQKGARKLPFTSHASQRHFSDFESDFENLMEGGSHAT